MNRLSKAILITLSGVVALAIAAFIGLNLYIQSPGTLERIQTELSKAVQMPLHIMSTTVTPWGGLRISGITTTPIDGTKIEAKSFDADYRVLPLLHGQLVVSRMTLDSPQAVWAQSADGSWRLPALAEPHERAAAGGSRESKEKTSSVSIESFEIKNGSIELVDAAQKRVALATDLNITYSPLHPEQTPGSISAAKISWQDALNFTGVRSKVLYQGGKLSFTDLQASLAGGAVQGSGSLQTEGKETPFEAALTLTGIDLAKLTTEANWQTGQYVGKLSGKASLHGSTQKFAEVEGSGSLTMADGQLRQLQMLQTIGLLLQIPELADLRLSGARADFHLKSEHTYVDRLILETPDLQLSAKGNARFDGRLSGDAQLAVSDRLGRELPTFIRDNFSPPGADGRRSIAFEISGHTDHPKTNLQDKILGAQNVTGEVQNLITNIFGNPGAKKKAKDKDKDKNKKPETENKAEPAPDEQHSTTPAPPAPVPAEP